MKSLFTPRKEPIPYGALVGWRGNWRPFLFIAGVVILVAYWKSTLSFYESKLSASVDEVCETWYAGVTRNSETEYIGDTTTYEYVPVVDLIQKNCEYFPGNCASRHTEEEVEQYLASNRVLERALYVAESLGCPVSVILAMDMLESNLRKSSLVKKTKNHGNIKCKCGRDKELRANHVSEGKCVAAYDKIEKSWSRYIKFDTEWESWIRKRDVLSRYRVVRKAKKQGLNAMAWVDIIHRSPYATDEQYGRKLRDIILQWNLEALDYATMKTDNFVVTSDYKFALAQPSSCRSNR